RPRCRAMFQARLPSTSRDSPRAACRSARLRTPLPSVKKHEYAFQESPALSNEAGRGSRTGRDREAIRLERTLRERRVATLQANAVESLQTSESKRPSREARG